MAQLYSTQPNTYKTSGTLLLVSVNAIHTIRPCSRNVGEASVPNLAYSVPSPGARLHTGRQEEKESVHSTAGIYPSPQILTPLVT